MVTRRDFLRSTGVVALGAAMPRFLSSTAFAAGNSNLSGSKDTILVMLQLTGGNDGLNTVIPYTDPLYAQYRPTIKIGKDQVKKIDDRFALHPALGGLATLLEKQSLCVVQGVGYPNPSGSHFRSMDIWNTGSTADNVTEGWIGKALKQKSSPAFHLTGPNEQSPLALAGAPMRAPSITSLDDFQLKLAAASGTESKWQRSIIEGATTARDNSPELLEFVKKTAVSAYEASNRLQEIGKNYQPKSPYPQTALGNRFKLAAQLINADLGARVFYLAIDGFDTHSGQGGANGNHANLLREVGDAVAAFYSDMVQRGHGDRVIVATFSEFGRRAKENGSRGTDHGSGAPMFVVGNRVKSGLVGEHPSLEKLEDGNLKHGIDFRSVYAAILENWLGVKADSVLGGNFKPTEIFKT